MLATVESLVLEQAAPAPQDAHRHFLSRLALEADAADVYTDLLNGVEDLVVIDARSAESYAKGHVPGAINVPHRTMSAETTASLSKDKLYVTYCDGLGCNASTKAAVKLTALGFRVKEMIGGIDWWVRMDGYPVVIGEARGSLRKNDAIACGC